MFIGELTIMYERLCVNARHVETMSSTKLAHLKSDIFYIQNIKTHSQYYFI